MENWFSYDHNFKHFILIFNQVNTLKIEQEHESLVLGSWLVSFRPDDIWKWICYLPCLQQTAASHQNQRVCRFTRSGGFLCRDERCSVIVLLQVGNWLRSTSSITLDSYDQMAVRVCVSDELVQFSTGPLHCCGETTEILNFDDESSDRTTSFVVMGNPHGCHFVSTALPNFQSSSSS